MIYYRTDTGVSDMPGDTCFIVEMAGKNKMSRMLSAGWYVKITVF